MWQKAVRVPTGIISPVGGAPQRTIPRWGPRAVPIVVAVLILCTTQVAAAGELGHWPLDGDAVDASGNGHDGTLMGDAHFVDDGVFGGALELDGDGFVEMTGYKGPLQAPWTLSCWVKTIGTGDMDILSWGTEGGGLKVEFRFNAGLLRIEHGNGNIRGDMAANDGEWHHAVTQLPEGVTIKGVLFYLDGKPLGIFAIGNGDNPFNITEGIDFNIGRSGPRGDRYFTGAIDDVRIYDQLLTAEEIQHIGARPQARQPDPANGAVGVNLPLLQWMPGDTAVLHTVYLGTSPDLTEADRVAADQPMALYYHAAGLQPGTTYYWRVDETEADMTTVHTGNVWSFIVQALTAYGPSPADGVNEAATSPTLNWLAGQAALEHHVYFGAAQEAVAQGNAATDKGLQAETTFAPGALDEATTYYWRVDEVVPNGTVRTGPVWSFTTILPVEDFESYDDDLDAKTTIFDTWIDGLTDGLSNSIVGHAQAPFAEQTIVHSGAQAMPFDYNNVPAPFYSEAERTFATAQDWTVNGVDTLVLYVRGRSANGAAPLYVTLTDASNRAGTVSHPDPAVLTRGTWTEWKVPLTDFAGVSLSRVKKIALGVGDKSTSAPGTAGLIYIDDIHLRRP